MTANLTLTPSLIPHMSLILRWPSANGSRHTYLFQAGWLVLMAGDVCLDTPGSSRPDARPFGRCPHPGVPNAG